MNSLTRKILYSLVIIVTITVVNIPEVAAQCQACKSTVETNLASGGTAGLGLNKGILYLLAMPYLMILSVAGIWLYRLKTRK